MDSQGAKPWRLLFFVVALLYASHLHAATPSQVNIMVLYSAQARAAVSNVETLIDQAVTQNNIYFQNSSVDVRLNLVFKGSIDHVEIDNLENVLLRMRNPSDGYLDNIFSLRQQHQADIVCLLTAIGSDGAWASVMGTPHVGFRNQAFAIIRADLMTNSILFAHEIAHTMGCNHDPGRFIGPLCYPYSIAHNFTGTNGLTYGTICSQHATIIPYFGNPAVSFAGVPTGSASHDNARTLNENASIVRQFRSAPPPAPANDSFAARATLTGYFASLTTNNELATREPAEPSHLPNGSDFNTLWWTWTAPASGTLTLDTFGSDFDTFLSAYSGSSLGALSLLAYNDNTPGGPYNSQAASRVQFQVQAGATYQIVAGGTARDAGNLRLNFMIPAPPPFLTVVDAAVTETAGTNAIFQVELSRPFTNAVRVVYSITDGSALAGYDYAGSNGSLTFPPGATNLDIVIPILSDTLAEDTERFYLNILSVSNAILSRRQAVCVISDDDAFAGCSGTALVLNGGYMEVPHSPSLAITGPVTIEAWIKRAAMGVPECLVEKYDCAGSGGFAMRITSADKVQFGTRDDCNIGSSVLGTSTLVAGSWYHLAGVWDGSQLRVYVNGALEGTLNSTRNPKAGTAPLRIGARANDLGAPFTGTIDQLRIWALARTEPEIRASMTRPLAGNEEGLAGLWKFEEGAGGLAYDSALKPNTAVLHGDTSWTASSAPSSCELMVGTLSADFIGGSSARLLGSVTTLELEASAAFEWGPTLALGNGAPVPPITNTLGETSVQTVIEGLSPGTLYYYRLIASNAAGGNSGAILSFRTFLPPIIQTGTATVDSATSATIRGTIMPNGVGSSFYFEWGSGESLSNKTIPVQVPAGSNTVTIAQQLTSLIPATTYRYRAVGFNVAGTNFGTEQTFETPPLEAPWVATQPATAVSASAATLNAAVDPNGSPTAAFFEWGTNLVFDQRTAITNVGTGSGFVPVSASISGLSSGTTYAFRIVAGNTSGTNIGQEFEFTTLLLPSAVTTPATNVLGRSAILMGHANPNGPLASAFFQWDTNLSFRNSTAVQSVGSGTNNVEITQALTNLNPGTTYFFRLVVISAAGTNIATELSFRTIPLPQVTTLGASNVTGDEAVLNGSIDPNGIPATAWFQWGKTTSYGNTTAPQPATGSNAVSTSNLLTNLEYNTLYNFRLVGSNVAGAVFGSNLTFRTDPAPTPIASFTASPLSGVAPLTVTFTDLSAGIITNRLWNFGNGVTTNTTATSVTITYPTFGTNTVTLTVMGPGGVTTTSRVDYIAVEGNPQVNVYVEAETGTLTAPLRRFSDPLAVEGEYVASSSNSGSATYSVNIPQPGDYIIWCRILAATPQQDSYHVSVNGGEEDVFDMAEDRWGPNWQWSVVNGRGRTGNPKTIATRVFSLAAGTNTIRFRVREPNAKIDRFLVSNNMSVQPTNPLPFITVTNASVVEGNTGTTNAGLNLLLTGAADLPVSIAYATSSGSAVAGSDFEHVSGTLAFALNQVSATIFVPIFGDTLQEPTENLSMLLSNPVNVTLRSPNPLVSILNDDLPSGFAGSQPEEESPPDDEPPTLETGHEVAVQLHIDLDPQKSSALLRLTGTPSRQFAIDISTNCSSWSTWTVVTNGVTGSYYLDVNTAMPGANFFRARELP